MNLVLVRALRWGGVLAAVVLVAGGAVGWLVGGQRGLVSAVIGAVVAVVFMGLTAASLLIAGRAKPGPNSLVVMAAVVVGVFLVKAVGFVLLMIWLRTEDWIDPAVFGVTALVAVIGTLAIDVSVMATTRVPIVELPRGERDSAAPDDGENRP